MTEAVGLSLRTQNTYLPKDTEGVSLTLCVEGHIASCKAVMLSTFVLLAYFAPPHSLVPK